MVKIWEILFLQHLHTVNCSFSSQAGLEITKMYAQAQLHSGSKWLKPAKNKFAL